MSLRNQILSDVSNVSNDIEICVQTMSIHGDQHHSKQLWIFGVDSCGKSVAIEAQGFTPWILVDFSDSSGAFIDEDDIESELKDAPFNAEFKRWDMTPFIGFTNNRKDRLFKVSCQTIKDYYHMVKYFLNSEYSIFHYKPKYDMIGKFIHDTGIRYQSWMTFSLANSEVVSTDRKQTTCCCEYIVHINDLLPLQEKHDIPRTLSCYIRHKMVSGQSIVGGREYRYFEGSAERDTILCVGIKCKWSDHTEICDKVFACCPFVEIEGITEIFKDESTMLKGVSEFIVGMDPDNFFIYNDPHNYFEDVFTRYEHSRQKSSGLDFLIYDRFSMERLKVSKFGLNLFGRNVLDMTRVVTRKLNYYTIDLRSIINLAFEDSIPIDDHSKYYSWIRKHKYDNFMSILMMDLNLMYKLEKNWGIEFEFAKITGLANISLTKAVSGGEQKRVMNALIEFCLEENIYINEGMVNLVALRLSSLKYPPTFTIPDEMSINSELRQHLIREYDRLSGKRKRKKQETHELKNFVYDIFSNIPQSSDKFEEELLKEGGSVLHPSPKYWKDEYISILDFASLYPSIMIANNLCYMTTVVQEEYLNIPGIRYIYIEIMKGVVIAVAQEQQGIFPKLLKKFLSARRAVKKIMKKEKDPLKKSVLDKEQLSLKVLCNATYGFTGVRKNAVLGMYEMMLMVTSMGRYYQLITVDYLAKKYAIPTIYGDTDSVFIWLQDDPLTGETAESYCSRLEEKYQVSDKYPEFSWNFVQSFYQGKGVDIVSEDPKKVRDAILNFVSYKIGEECDKILYPDALTLEFENAATQVWMNKMKKSYAYLKIDPDNACLPRKWKMTGLPHVRRDWCPWVRRILNQLSEMYRMKTDSGENLESFIRSECNKILKDELPLTDYIVTCFMNPEESYSDPENEKVIQFAKKLRSRGKIIHENVRLAFVVISTGDKKLLHKLEDPQYVRHNKMSVDRVYYLEKQFLNPIKTFLTFHADLIRVSDIVTEFVERVKTQNMKRIVSNFYGRT